MQEISLSLIHKTAFLQFEDTLKWVFRQDKFPDNWAYHFHEPFLCICHETWAVVVYFS